MNKNQLRYFQEDIIIHLDIISAILCFGFGFNLWGWFFVASTAIQWCYAAYHYGKMKQDERLAKLEEMKEKQKKANSNNVTFI